MLCLGKKTPKQTSPSSGLRIPEESTLLVIIYIKYRVGVTRFSWSEKWFLESRLTKMPESPVPSYFLFFPEGKTLFRRASAGLAHLLQWSRQNSSAAGGE